MFEEISTSFCPVLKTIMRLAEDLPRVELKTRRNKLPAYRRRFRMKHQITVKSQITANIT